MKHAILIFLFTAIAGSMTAQPMTPAEVNIPMRDGDSLAADVYIPEPAMERPTILVQTPYNKFFYRYNLPVGFGTNPDTLMYNFVIMDWRGFYASSDAAGGESTRGEDGYDAIEWISQQAWSDGSVGTWGASALGNVQFMTAEEQHPAHVCAVPMVASPEFNYQMYYPNGVYREEYVEQLDGLGFGMSGWLEAHPYHDWLWTYVEDSTWAPEDIHIPMLMIGGWYDHATEWLLKYFNGIRTHSPDSIAAQHKLMMGPWAHGSPGQQALGSLNQGALEFPGAEDASDGYAKSFFDYYLLHAYNGWPYRPVVKYFQMGESQWHASDNWPPPSDLFTDHFLYLHADGGLSQSMPAAGDTCSSYLYDPRDPSPTIGGPTLHADLLQGPYDQAPVVESRDDIIIFDTGILDNPLHMAGKVSVKLYVSSNRTDTDFAVRLCDVYPDGRSMLLADGIFRMRFRNGFSTTDTSLITPGEIYPVVITLPDVAQTFPAGHRIRLDITSSNHPRYHRNINNGGPLYESGDTLTALNKVYHNEAYSSHLRLPINSTVVNPVPVMQSIRIYPNPVCEGNRLHISGMQDKHLEIYSLSGRLVKSISINSHETTINHGLKRGMYILHAGGTRQKLMVW
ncbi:MAG: CocE/NonD family hydrolase [Bacteroidota bacterium]